MSDPTPSLETPCVDCGAGGYLKHGYEPARCAHHHEVTAIISSGSDSVPMVKACGDWRVLDEVRRRDQRVTVRAAADRQLKKMLNAKG